MNTPTGVQHRGACQACGEAGVIKCGVAVVLVQGVALIRKIRDYEVGPAVIVVIGKIDAHSRISAAIAVHGDLSEEADFLKRPVPFGVIKKFNHRVIGDDDVNVAIAIVIGDGDAKSFARFRKADLLRDFGEMTVAVIVIDQRSDRLEIVGMAVGAVAFFVLSAPDVVEVPLDITENDEVKEAIVIQIHPGSAGGPAAARDAGLLGHVGKGAVAIVVIELIAAVGGHIQILEAVVVVITYGDSHTITRAL